MVRPFNCLPSWGSLTWTGVSGTSCSSIQAASWASGPSQLQGQHSSLSVHVSVQVPAGAPADSAALTAAINSQAGKLAALESQVALAQQRLADKADAGATGALRWGESAAEVLQCGNLVCRVLV